MKINSSKLHDDKLSQLECYANVIAELKNEIIVGSSCTLVIYFEKDEKIKFVHPLFLVYILNFYELLQSDDKYSSQDIKIIINIENLDNKIQAYIKTYLTQYIDCQIILVVDTEFRDRNKPPSTFTDKKILLYTAEKEKNLSLLKKQKYSFLPIVKIANNRFIEDFQDIKDYWITNQETGKPEKISSYDNRKIFYKSLQLETIEQGAYKKKSEKVWTDIFEIYLELTQNGAYITEKFKEIFREIVENIQKHTKIDDIPANGYISFYIDSSKKTCDCNLYELIVSDDYQNGFLSKYLETIIQEKVDEPNELIKKEYQKIIDDLDDENYEEVLKNIFDLNYVLSAQKERITKHFGLPLLLKIVNQLKKLSKEKYKNDSYVNLEVYLNKDELSFLIKYKKDGKVEVHKLLDNSVKGTYLHLSFPQNLHLDNPVIKTQKPLKLTSKYYKELLEEKESLEKHLEHFKYYFDLNNRSGLSDEIDAVIVDYTKIEETSNFLRDLYSFAFLNSVDDILVVNYPIEENIEYLKLLSETTDVSKICNIAFLNKEYPQVLFIGGANHQEMLKINAMLSQTYNYNKRNFLEAFQEQDSINLTSNLFYTNNDNKQIFYPFELFLPNPTNRNELFYALMLDNFLEQNENFEEIHLDLKDDYHIKKFYYLKYIFENSQWVKLMSFDLAIKIKNKYTDFENVIFVGIEKYSSSFIAELEYLLDQKLQSYIISDLDSQPILEQFDKFKRPHDGKRFIFIRPSVFESDIDKNLAKNLSNYDKYTFIALTSKHHKPQEWIASYSKNLDDTIELASKCTLCFPSSGVDKPLYEIDRDKYNIKDLYHTHDEYKNDDKIFQISWENAIYFPHIERNTNHYLYYIRTIQFFKNNKMEIQKYFKTEINFTRDEKVPVILTPAHNTNAEFVALINEVVFENDAIVHSLSLNNKEQGYFSIDNLISTYKNKEDYYSFYFVDDTISSGEAFKYIFSVLSSFFENKFQAIFTLIDRTNKKDLKLFNKYYENKNFYPYIKINIHPIKTGFENCYLCERKKIFEKIATDSSLVTIKYTFQKKAKDLAKKNASEIEYELLEPITDLKNYLRMSSTEYIYQHIDEFRTWDSIDSQFNKYYGWIKKYFIIVYLQDKPLTSEIEKFLEVESKIAFLKSMAFPKVYFFKTLRESIHKYIYEEIRKFTYINRQDIKVDPLLTTFDFDKLDKIDNIKEIVSYYKEKDRTNLDYYSFLLSLGSHLGINHILSYEVIMYYYKITEAIKSPEKYEKYKRLLNIYPIVVKQLTTYSKEKSKYFEQELAKFYKEVPFKYTRIFSRIFGLFVENTTHLNINENIFESITKEQSIDEKIKFFKSELEKIVSNKIKSICIDLNENIDNCLLIDVLNEFRELDKEGNEEIVYKGAFVSKEINDKEITIEHRKEQENQKKYNIWCNFYQDYRTYIRITNNDEKLTPMGVIVIEHTKLNEESSNFLNEHLSISRWVLAYQNIICKLFQDYNMISAIRSKYDEFSEKKIVEEKNKQISNSIHMINHTYRNYNKYSSFLMDIYKLDEIEPIKESINSLIEYSRGIELHSILGSLNTQKLENYEKEANSVNKNETIYSINNRSNIFTICSAFLNGCSKYIKTNPKILENAAYHLELNEIEEFDIKYHDLCGISDDYFDSMFFELIFNIVKRNPEGSKIFITIDVNKIIIENSGIRIEEDQRETIFNEHVTTTSYSFGLGLPTIRKTLSLFDLKIECIPPVNDGYDCCFKIYKKGDM